MLRLAVLLESYFTAGKICVMVMKMNRLGTGSAECLNGCCYGGCSVGATLVCLRRLFLWRLVKSYSSWVIHPFSEMHSFDRYEGTFFFTSPSTESWITFCKCLSMCIFQETVCNSTNGDELNELFTVLNKCLRPLWEIKTLLVF